MRLRRSVRAAVLAALAVSALAPAVSANGRFPEASQLVVDPADAAHLVLRTTYGLVQSLDAGQSWQWVCEQSIGLPGDSVEDPPIGVTGDGTILAGTSLGLAVSHDRACGFAFAPSDVGTSRIIDLAVERAAPSHAVVMNVVFGQTTQANVYETLDDGKTFAAVGTPVPATALYETIDVAPSDAQRLYASGSGGKPVDGRFFWSADRGASWNTVALGTGFDVPYVAAVDPNDADRVWVRVDSSPGDTILFSSDGGKTWSTAYVGVGDLLGFALSPDGGKVAIGGPADGLLVADATGTTFAFAKANDVGVRCLAWSGAGLYACGDECDAPFTVGLSSDDGHSFAPLYRASMLAPLACGGATSTGQLCPNGWPGVQAALAKSFDGGCAGTPVVDAGADGESASDAGDALDAGSAGSPGAAAPSASSDDSSGCTAGRGGAAAAGAWIVALAMAFLARRRR